jgi:hypothetical protein
MPQTGTTLPAPEGETKKETNTSSESD